MKKTLLVSLILLVAFTAALIGKSGFVTSEALMPDILAELYEPTHLNITQGTVLVNNDATINGVILYEGDSVEVLSGAAASIVFFDNSVTRLTEGTKITIVEITEESGTNAKNRVRLKLNLGEAWSKVTKIVNSESTFEVATTEVAATVRGSAFDVIVTENGDTKVMAVEHSLVLQKLTDSTNESDESVVVLEGQKASSYLRVKRPTNTPAKYSPAGLDLPDSSVGFKVEKISEEEKDANWFKENQYSDKVHAIKVQRKVEKAQEKLVGALPGSLAYQAKTLRDQTLLLGALTAERRAEIKTKIAERKILEAQVLMRKGDGTAAETQLTEAKNLLMQISQVRDNTSDLQAKANLAAKILGVINNSKKMANLISVPSRDYRTKEFLYEIEVEVAPEEEKAKIKKDQYQRRIIEAYDVAKSEDKESAIKLLKDLSEDMQNDFAAVDIENNISKTDLDDLVANPYLNAVLQKIEVANVQHIAAENEQQEIDDPKIIAKNNFRRPGTDIHSSAPEPLSPEEINHLVTTQVEPEPATVARSPEQTWLITKVAEVKQEAEENSEPEEPNEDDYFSSDVDGSEISIEENQNEAHPIDYSEIQLQAEAELKAEAEARAIAEAEAIARVEAESAAIAKAEAIAEAAAIAQAEAEATTQAWAEAIARAEAIAIAEAEATAQAEAEAIAEAEAEEAARVEAIAIARAEAIAIAEEEARAEAEAEAAAQAEAEEEARVEVEATARAEAEAAQAEAEATAQAEAEAEAQIEVEASATAEAEATATAVEEEGAPATAEAETSAQAEAEATVTPEVEIESTESEETITTEIPSEETTVTIETPEEETTTTVEAPRVEEETSTSESESQSVPETSATSSSSTIFSSTSSATSSTASPEETTSIVDNIMDLYR